VKSDPITFLSDRIGWYVVNVNANDIAAMGGTPRWFLVTMLLPERRTTTADIERIMKDLRSSCAELGVTVVGGHSEVTHGLDHPILSGTMLGEAGKDELVKTGDIREGDLLFMTKAIAIEATSIMALAKREEVIGVFGEVFYRRCSRFLENPGISVVRDAMRARASARISGMHDPTEGGVLSGAYEMARGSDVGLRLQLDRVPVYEETSRLCAHFGISPYSSIASGSLLIAVPARERESLEKAFADNTPLTPIGVFTGKGEKMRTVRGGREEESKPSGIDDITKLL
jgi:hydrogenase expression/formation protein HypE